MNALRLQVFNQNTRVKINNHLSKLYIKTLIDMNRMQSPVLI
jgi:hypothetical protein